MTVRTHSEYDAYIPDAATGNSARIVLLKAERMDLAGAVRTYVDAIVRSEGGLGAFSFIRVSGDGAAVFPKRLAQNAPALCSALASPVAQWIAQKGSGAHLVADLFEQDEVLSNAMQTANATLRALPGASPYEVLFSEGERYASVTPYVRDKSVVDLNPGLGYGLNTLRNVASRISAEIPEFSRAMYPRIETVAEPSQVALWLDADPARLDEIVAHCRSSISKHGCIVLSIRDERAKSALERFDARFEPMVRPGAGSLGALDEWLALIDVQCGGARTAEESPHYVAPDPPRKLRILFALRPSAESVFGGDVVQVRQTVDALRRRGHTVELSTAPRLQAAGFDIVHLTNLTSPEETLPQAESVQGFGGPVVLMPIFIDHADETVWGMATSLGVFLQSQDDADLHDKLALLERRSIVVPNIDAPPKRNDIFPGYTEKQQRILQLVDFVIANAHSEMHRLYRYLACNLPYAIAPSAVDAGLYGTHRRAEFLETYGFADFVVMPGRYEPRKNQLLLFEAIKRLGYPLVCVGNNREPAFAHAVRSYRPGNAVYFSHMSESELAALFAAARVVAVPSWDEVVSLTSLNGAVSEASLVLTRNSYEHEYFRDDAEYCDPASVESIRAALERAWTTHDERSERRRMLSERVRREYNWDVSAASTEAAYYRALQARRRREPSRAV